MESPASSGRCSFKLICLSLPCIVLVILILYLHKDDNYRGDFSMTKSYLLRPFGLGQPSHTPVGLVSPLIDTPTWNWTDVFSFVPNGLRHCPDLFENTDKTSPFPESFQREYDLFIGKLISVGDLEDDTSATFIEASIAYYHMVRSPFVRTVCETGFSGGHSSFLWLQANPNTTVYSFDIGTRSYARPMAEYLQQRFPGRLTVTWGNSTKTLPAFRQANPAVKCDVISIDGGHTHPVCLSDYNNFRQMASVDNVIILDNYPDDRRGWLQKLGDVWESAKREGQIIEIFQCDYTPEHRQGFSVGRLNPCFITV